MRKVILLLIVSLPMVSLAYYTRMANGIVWTYDVKDGKAMIVEGEDGSTIPRGTLGDIVIPETLAGCPVTSIESYAFHGCQALKSVTIPESVTHIKSWAFMYCTGLTSVMIPSGVTEIGDYAFRDCCSLESVTIPKRVTYIGNGAFMGCSCLESVTFLAREARVWYSAFDGCNRLKVVNIEDLTAWCGIDFLTSTANPLSYAHKLFVNGSEVIDLRIPDGVESIGYSVFSGCSGLKSVTIPSSVTSIGASAFSGCNGLTTVYVASKDAERVAALYPFDKSVKFVDPFLPTGLTASDGAFVDRVCISWTDAKDAIAHDIYRSTTEIRPDSAMETGVTSPYSDTSAEPGVEYYYWVAAVNSSGSIVSSAETGYRAVSLLLSKLTDAYEMGGGNGSVSVDANAAWSAVSDADWITFGTNYGGGNGTLAYMVAANATTSTRTGTITVTAGANTPYPVTKEIVVAQDAGVPPPAVPTDVEASDGLYEDRVSVSWSAAVGATSYNIYRSTTSSRPNEAIETNATSPYNDTTAEPGVEYHYWIAAVNSSGSVVSSVETGHRAVSLSLDKLTDFYWTTGGDYSVLVEGNAAWNAYSSVDWIVLEVQSGVGDGTLSYSVFANTTLADRDGTITVIAGLDTPNPVTKTIEVSQNGTLDFEVCGDELRWYTGKGGEVMIPAGVKRIADHAFDNCREVTSVTIPSTVTDIGEWAFSYCDGLTSVTIPASVTVIWEGTFYYSGLMSVTIPPRVTGIGRYAFRDCHELAAVTLPPSVVGIGGDAFYGCTRLSVVYVGKGDAERVKGLYEWPDQVKFIEIVAPVIDDDPGATVTGDAETGFVIKPSEGKTAVEVTIPQGVDAAKVTVEVSPKVASVKPNGAKVKIASGGADITEFLNVPVADGNGVVDLTKATVKEAIVKEAMDVEKGAKIVLDAANPSLTTPNTRKGLFYQFREGTTLGGMKDGDSTIGDGNPWKPEITVKGGNSAFYSIGVGKGE